MIDRFPPPAPARFPGVAWTQGFLRAQRWMWSEAWCKAWRRPLPSMAYARRLGDGRRFESHRGAWMGVLVPMIVVSQFVDVLLAQGVIHVAAIGPARPWLHAALLFASLWAIVWAVSHRSAMRHVDHQLSERALTLAVGFNQLCHLPLAAIADLQVIDHRAARPGDDWLDTCKLKSHEVSVVAFLDKPTLLITLADAASGAWCTRNGVRHPLRRRVAVYVDQPVVMQTAITAALPPALATPT